MKEVDVKSIRNFTEEVGDKGTELKIRQETNGGTTKLQATIEKDGKEVGSASREDNGMVILCLRKPDMLSAAEFTEVFNKVGACFAELIGYTTEEEN